LAAAAPPTASEVCSPLVPVLVAARVRCPVPVVSTLICTVCVEKNVCCVQYF